MALAYSSSMADTDGSHNVNMAWRDAGRLVHRGMTVAGASACGKRALEAPGQAVAVSEDHARLIMFGALVEMTGERCAWPFVGEMIEEPFCNLPLPCPRGRRGAHRQPRGGSLARAPPQRHTPCPPAADR